MPQLGRAYAMAELPGDLKCSVTDLGGKLYFISRDSGGFLRLYEYDGISDHPWFPAARQM